jgi:cytoskeletal protein RodZ
MPKNFLTSNNLRWLTVCLFLLLMVLLLALNLFGQPNQGASATNSTPTAQSNSVVNCQKVLHLTCAQAEQIIGTANANSTATAAAKANKAATATTKAHTAGTATAKASATAATATAVAKAKPTATVTVTVTVTVSATP